MKAQKPRFGSVHPIERGHQNSNSLQSTTKAFAQSCEGILELHPRGYGFLRRVERNLARHADDIFVSESLVQRTGLRAGAFIRGHAKKTRGNEGPRLCRIDEVNGLEPKLYCERPLFKELTPTNPTRPLCLERENESNSIRILDLLCPFGLGQRALIASPPRAGKTSLLKEIGCSITSNYPDLHLTTLLIDERPEEVTDFRCDVDGEVFASSLDEDVANHERLARLVLDRCQRIAETGKDVVLLVDSLTRLSRACNKLPQPSGAVGAGGLNLHALEMPKRLFASARAFKEGGSLTIVATVLISTENRMDEIIFREFKGTGNLDIVLSQQLADRRIWPAIDLEQSATRRIELLQNAETLRATTMLRNTLLKMPTLEAMKELTTKLANYPTNAAFIEVINRSYK